jgi:hypothetical protein
MLAHGAMEEDILADAPPPAADQRVQRLHEYWQAVHPPGGGLPGRQHVDPTVLPPALLPFLWLADVGRAPLRFRYRLLGTEQVRVLGRDYTGRWIDEVHPAFPGSAAAAQFIAAAEEGRPGYRRGSTLIIVPKGYLSMERLILPLARDGRTVDMLLAISVYHKAKPGP